MSFGPGNPLWDEQYTDPRVPSPPQGEQLDPNETSVPPVIGKIFYTTDEGTQQGPSKEVPAFPPMKNSYVPNMEYVAQERATGIITVTLLVNDGLIDAVTGFYVPISSYGRTIKTDASTTVYGYDYLGQPMSETINGAGNKAFYYAYKQSGTAGINWGARYGLPYKLSSGVVAGFTFTAADETDPATAATGDTRGTIQQDVAGSTIEWIEIEYIPETTNMHGVRQA